MSINEKRLEDEFIKLVSIDSLSFQERNMADYLKIKLTELGFYVTEDDAGSRYSGNAGNLHASLEGELEGPPLLFSAHMDTVVPGKNKKAVKSSDGRITSDGKTILGADDCSGIAAIIEALHTIQEKGLPHRNIEILFPIAEEVYLRGTEVFDFKKVKAKEAYVLDLSGPVGDAAIKAPTLFGFTIRIMGKASHAGFAPEKGINAIAIAAKIITKIEQGRIDEETTVNIGKVEGGLATNIVSEICEMQGEVRSFTHEKAEHIVQTIKLRADEIGKEEGAAVQFETNIGCIAYTVSETSPVVSRFETVCKELSIATHLTNTFGGSDNNNFVRHGIEGIVLACGMTNPHSCEEYTTIEELSKISNIVVKLMTSEV